MSKLFDTRKVSGIVMASLASFLLVALFTYAATTISTNINTAGTLTVSDTSTLTGAVTMSAAATVGTTLTVNGAATLGDAASDAIVLTGNASTTNSFTVGNNLYVTGIASTTGALIVGGDSTNGTIAGLIHGTCNLTQVSIAATSSVGTSCTSATGIRSAYKVFVSATSTLTSAALNGSNGFIVVGASSTAANTIGVEISNLTGAANTVAGTLNFWAVR